MTGLKSQNLVFLWAIFWGKRSLLNCRSCADRAQNLPGPAPTSYVPSEYWLPFDIICISNWTIKRHIIAARRGSGPVSPWRQPLSGASPLQRRKNRWWWQRRWSSIGNGGATTRVSRTEHTMLHRLHLQREQQPRHSVVEGSQGNRPSGLGN